jgi:pyruvate formate lyase activating enzyme
MLKACGQKGLHRVVDTSGFADSKTLLEVAKHTDLFLFDLKLMDPENHKKWTGVSNQLILKNLKILAETGANINIRIPLIKNVNTNQEEIQKMAEYISSLDLKISDSKIADPQLPIVNLLPYHNIASGKYKKLEIPYDEGEMDEPSDKEIQQAEKIFRSFGIKTEVGG